MSTYRFLATYQDASCTLAFDHVPTVNEVRDVIAAHMRLKFVPALKYVDPEDDLVTIECSSDLEEAMKLVFHFHSCRFSLLTVTSLDYQFRPHRGCSRRYLRNHHGHQRHR